MNHCMLALPASLGTVVFEEVFWLSITDARRARALAAPRLSHCLVHHIGLYEADDEVPTEATNLVKP